MSSPTLTEAMKNMREYLVAHNYGKMDYPIYSKDPEWQRLNQALINAIAEN
jgi:hypothetical protein